MNQNITLLQYIQDAASNKPAPGGGSVAALGGILGSCMASMAANFTTGKQKYAHVEQEIQTLLKEMECGRQQLLAYMEEDETAFAEVGKAYALPKSNEGEIDIRKKTIQQALINAMNVPLKVMRTATELLEKLPFLAKEGNPNLVSDTGVAAVFLEASVQSAMLNVQINIASLKDNDDANQADDESKQLLERAEKAKKDTMTLVTEKIKR